MMQNHALLKPGTAKVDVRLTALGGNRLAVETDANGTRCDDRRDGPTTR